MRLIRAELLKARRRQATWVLLIVALLLTAAIYLLIGKAIGGASCAFRFDDFSDDTCVIAFPGAYALIDQFAFATLGGVLAIVYAAAFVGADWNWGTLRNVIARGESRAMYLLAKAAGLAIVLAIGCLAIFFFAFVMTYLTAFTNGIPVASPLRGHGLEDLGANLILGYLVVLERAALGLAVAVVLRSQLAGAVVGIVLYLGEGIVTTYLTLTSIGRNFGNGGFGGLQAIGPEWFQYLPMTVGNQLLSWAPGVAGDLATGGVQGFFLKPVPLEQALPAVLIYLFGAIAISILAFNRQEIA
ncbi:MAG: type transport system permease protein [Chloroflexota bacterium]|jgi:ABC-type transport system involved in multi-copper enzyme maturation permease subunit|nr:type transport system permease protein [Chloroflexota bacterium]